jgi:hypothetical protein
MDGASCLTIYMWSCGLRDQAPGSVDRETLSHTNMFASIVCKDKYIKHTHALAVLSVLLLMSFATHAQGKSLLFLCACADLCSFWC